MIFRKNDVPTPVYYQLQVAIKNKIESGEWKSGSMIPPERVFTEEYQVSVGTVKKALSNLVNDGYLLRKQGKGTFVTGTSLRRDQLRYYRLYKQFHDESPEIDVKLIDIQPVKGDKQINRNLNLKLSQPLFRVKRVLLTDTTPLIYTISYLPQHLFKELDHLPRNLFEKELFYLILEENYSIPTVSNRELIGAIAADETMARFLEVEIETPLVSIEMLSYTYKERPYEYRLSYCRTSTRKIFREY
jgi:DNA-binding GntR family transcriptional regulator